MRERLAIMGTPERIAEQLHLHEEAGIDRIYLTFLCHGDLEQVEILGKTCFRCSPRTPVSPPADTPYEADLRAPRKRAGSRFREAEAAVMGRTTPSCRRPASPRAPWPSARRCPTSSCRKSMWHRCASARSSSAARWAIAFYRGEACI